MLKKVLTNPVILIIACVEFCTGILRNGVMHWYPMFAKEVGFKKEFWVSDNWGLALLIAGLLGGIFTGWMSDRFFQSRRAPMATILYCLMLLATAVMGLSLDLNWWFAGIAVMAISMSVIGVHGIFSGTATADFAGAKNTGAAVGIVDGMVYLGTGLQSLVIGWIVPTGEAAKDPANWFYWPLVLLPAAGLGLLLIEHEIVGGGHGPSCNGSACRGEGTGHRLAGAGSGKVGEGAGRPGLARCFDVLPFRRSRPAPRSRFPRALRLAALTFGPCRIIRPGHCCPGRGADVASSDASGPHPAARGEQADAIHRRPQGPPDSPSPGLHRSTTARRHRGTWIRRPPHRRVGPIVPRVSPQAGSGR